MNNKNPPNSSCLLTVKKVTLIVTLTAVVVMVIGSYYVNCLSGFMIGLHFVEETTAKSWRIL